MKCWLHCLTKLLHCCCVDFTLFNQRKEKRTSWTTWTTLTAASSAWRAASSSFFSSSPSLCRSSSRGRSTWYSVMIFRKCSRKCLGAMTWVTLPNLQTMSRRPFRRTAFMSTTAAVLKRQPWWIHIITTTIIITIITITGAALWSWSTATRKRKQRWRMSLMRKCQPPATDWPDTTKQCSGQYPSISDQIIQQTSLFQKGRRKGFNRSPNFHLRPNFASVTFFRTVLIYLKLLPFLPWFFFWFFFWFFAFFVFFMYFVLTFKALLLLPFLICFWNIFLLISFYMFLQNNSKLHIRS